MEFVRSAPRNAMLDMMLCLQIEVELTVSVVHPQKTVTQGCPGRVAFQCFGSLEQWHTI